MPLRRAGRARTAMSIAALAALTSCGGPTAQADVDTTVAAVSSTSETTETTAPTTSATSSTTAPSATTPPPATAPPTTTPPTTSPPTTAPSTTARPTRVSTTSTTARSETTAPTESFGVRVGADVLADDGFAMLAGKRVGLIVNQTSTIRGTHLIDAIDEEPDVDLRSVFAPEHGVRGTADAGADVDDTVDSNTGVPIHSLFGANKAPTAATLADLDVLVFDIQDVGTRFYTYISTMGLAMEAAERAGVSFVVLDRPNPLGADLVAGHVRDDAQDSFIGQYPIPSVYGLTAGELAQAIVGERWLGDLSDLDLDIVEVDGWSRSDRWAETGRAWVPPSPGLPTVEATLAYPGTVLFEATTVGYGKGTDAPFTTIGAPWIDGDRLAATMNGLGLPGVRFDAVTFTPRWQDGMTFAPRWQDARSEGVRYRITDPATFRPVEAGIWLIDAISKQSAEAGEGSIIDRTSMFDLLAGTTDLRRQLESGRSPGEMIQAWQAEVSTFEQIRRPYLLYR